MKIVFIITNSADSDEILRSASFHLILRAWDCQPSKSRDLSFIVQSCAVQLCAESLLFAKGPT